MDAGGLIQLEPEPKVSAGMTNGGAGAAARARAQRRNRAIDVLQMPEPFFTAGDTNASRASSSNDLNVRDYWDAAARHNYPSLRLHSGALKAKPGADRSGADWSGADRSGAERPTAPRQSSTA